MRAVVTRAAGGPEVLELQERGIHVLQADHVLIRVIATSVNEIDLIERKEYAGVILGHECSGQIVGVGKNVTGWQVNEWVCALLKGEGYAELVAVPSNLLFRVPQNITLDLAASLPVVACSTYSALFHWGMLDEGKILLIHDGYGEYGIFALQVAKALYNTQVFVVSDDDEKLKRYKDHGAYKCFNWMDYGFAQQVLSLTGKRGADIILNYGAVNILDCQRCLAVWGIIVVVFYIQDKRTAEVSMSDLKAGSGTIMVSDLRQLIASSSEAYLSLLVKAVNEQVWPLLENGKIKCKKYMTMPLSRAAAAHELMERKKAEKIILTTQEEQEQEWKLTSLFTKLGAKVGNILGKRWPRAPTEAISTKRSKLE